MVWTRIRGITSRDRKGPILGMDRGGERGRGHRASCQIRSRREKNLCSHPGSRRARHRRIHCRKCLSPSCAGWLHHGSDRDAMAHGVYIDLLQQMAVATGPASPIQLIQPYIYLFVRGSSTPWLALVPKGRRSRRGVLGHVLTIVSCPLLHMSVGANSGHNSHPTMPQQMYDEPDTTAKRNRGSMSNKALA